MGIVIAILIFGLIVTVHEFGHFIIARKNGIFVKEFSIGFGPRILSKEGKSGTRFSWKAIPFGGSCTMLGELEDEDDNTDDERSYDKKSVWARAKPMRKTWPSSCNTKTKAISARRSSTAKPSKNGVASKVFHHSP